MIKIDNDMTIRNLLLLIMLISLIVLAVYNYIAGRSLNLKANSNTSQFKECRKIANVSECNSVVEELNRK
jgi:disulfide bond formation protein DsbB